jgi:hypothetical protein
MVNAKFDKAKVRCTYCGRTVSMWGGSREMYKHNQPYPRDGSRCPGSGTKGWARP